MHSIPVQIEIPWSSKANLLIPKHKTVDIKFICGCTDARLSSGGSEPHLNIIFPYPCVRHSARVAA